VLSETRYALNGDVRVAFRTTPAGERDLVFVSNWLTNCEVFPELPSLRGWVEKMATLGRLIFFDQPGTGASDPVSLDSLPTLEQWTDSIQAVLDELESTDAVIITMDGSFAVGALFAATYPRRTSALIVLEGYAAARPDEGDTASERDQDPAPDYTPLWGTGELQHVLNPDMPWNEEVRAEWARDERLAASPKIVELFMSLLGLLDVRDVLPSIRVPTLILQHADDEVLVAEQGRYLRDHIPNATYVEWPGRNMYLFVEPGWRRCFEEISGFLTGSITSVDDDRVLATVLFTDIVDSTRRAAEMGDRDWRSLLDAHDAVVRAQLRRFRGREVSTAGDSGGIAVHIGARVAALAGGGEVLVSGTVRDLVVGSGLQLHDRGLHELKGVPGEWRVFAVAD
jgi:pimeloyl-ACP methyl ester carboxylesterase